MQSITEAELNDWQREALETTRTSEGRVLVPGDRQVGKSTFAIFWALNEVKGPKIVRVKGRFNDATLKMLTDIATWARALGMNIDEERTNLHTVVVGDVTFTLKGEHDVFIADETEVPDDAADTGLRVWTPVS